MPGWKLHTFSGMILTALLMILLIMIFEANAVYFESISLFALIVAGFAAVLGADLPDFDYRHTKIRHALGPVLACFITFGYLYTNGSEAELDFAFTVFILIVLIFAVFAFLPLEHHGRLHSISAAVLYSIVWAGISYYFFEINELVSIVIIFGFAFSGYFLHLLLDLDLKL